MESGYWWLIGLDKAARIASTEASNKGGFRINIKHSFIWFWVKLGARSDFRVTIRNKSMIMNLHESAYVFKDRDQLG
jgi:hypothetical protein